MSEKAWKLYKTPTPKKTLVRVLQCDLFTSCSQLMKMNNDQTTFLQCSVILNDTLMICLFTFSVTLYFIFSPQKIKVGSQLMSWRDHCMTRIHHIQEPIESKRCLSQNDILCKKRCWIHFRSTFVHNCLFQMLVTLGSSRKIDYKYQETFFRFVYSAVLVSVWTTK